MTRDSTLGGYLTAHERPPAFEGSDGYAYSVAILVDDEPGADRRYGAALLFVRWSEAGDAPAGHVETEYLAYGATPVEADGLLRELTLYEVKEQLDRAIARRDALGEW